MDEKAIITCDHCLSVLLTLDAGILTRVVTIQCGNCSRFTVWRPSINLPKRVAANPRQ
jgi:hypothetical protein